MRTLSLLALMACGSAPDAASAPQPAAKPAAVATPAPPTPPAPPAVDHAAHHAGGSDHMAKMAATRDGLRQQLGPAYDAPVPGLDTADATKGKATYDAKCASCHGAAGKGDGPAAAGLTPPPSDLTDAFHARYYSDAGRVHIIKNGSPDTAMAAFSGGLAPAQILDVYAYIRGMRGASGSPAPGAAPGADPHAGHH
jgi:mono/diheme cytochrome c family protein